MMRQNLQRRVYDSNTETYLNLFARLNVLKTMAGEGTLSNETYSLLRKAIPFSGPEPEELSRMVSINRDILTYTLASQNREGRPNIMQLAQLAQKLDYRLLLCDAVYVDLAHLYESDKIASAFLEIALGPSGRGERAAAEKALGALAGALYELSDSRNYKNISAPYPKVYPIVAVRAASAARTIWEETHKPESLERFAHIISDAISKGEPENPVFFYPLKAMIAVAVESNEVVDRIASRLMEEFYGNRRG